MPEPTTAQSTFSIGPFSASHHQPQGTGQQRHQRGVKRRAKNGDKKGRRRTVGHRRNHPMKRPDRSKVIPADFANFDQLATVIQGKSSHSQYIP